MAAAARDNGVPLDILYSVGLTETGRSGVLGPFDLNVDGRSVHSDSLRAGAGGLCAAPTAPGAKFIDIGCMQINHHLPRRAFRLAGGDVRSRAQRALRRRAC